MPPSVTPTPKTVSAWYDQNAAGYDVGHYATRRKYKVIEQSIQRLLLRGQVLDLGCGTGRLLNHSNAKRVVGIDLSTEMLRVAVKKSPSVVRADGHQLPFASGAFDAVIAAQGVIRYMRTTLAFSEIFRVLRPGGQCAVHQFGQGKSLRSLLTRKPPEDDEFALRDVEDLAGPARASGLQVQAVELFRSLRRYPYAVRVHPRLPTRLSEALWNHCVLHLRKPI